MARQADAAEGCALWDCLGLLLILLSIPHSFILFILINQSPFGEIQMRQENFSGKFKYSKLATDCAEKGLS